MRFTLVILAAIGVVSATLDAGYVYQPPKASHGDVRGPCPFLNTMANHGYLPHSGKHASFNTALDLMSRAGVVITTDLRAGLTDSLVTMVAVRLGITKNEAASRVVTDPSLNYFDLNELFVLARTGLGSLLHYDTANPPVIDRKLVDQLIGFATSDPSASGKVLTCAAANRDHAQRYSYEQALLPPGTPPMTPAELQALYGPHAFNTVLMVYVMGRNGKLTKDAAKDWLRHGKIPDTWSWAPNTLSGEFLSGKLAECFWMPGMPVP
jgi:hypothetical protein